MLDSRGTCRPAGLVESRRDIFLDIGPESVLVVGHPGEQPGHSVRRIRGSRLTGDYPAGEQAATERAEAPAGVVHLLGLLIAGGDEGLVKADRLFWGGFDDPGDPPGGVFKFLNERV
jgi:hypothetical protein